MKDVQDLYHHALQGLAGYEADTADRIQAALKADPGFAMGHCLWGAFMMLGYNRGYVGIVAEACSAAKQRAATPLEHAHAAALEHWVSGDLEAALLRWEGILAAWPRDLLALRLLHANYFWLGRSAQMRASLERVAPHWAGDAGFLACLAFALEETGDYAAAERTGRRAVEIDPTDVWGAHSVAHVLEMQGRPDEGLAWLAALEPHWGGKGAFLHHLWWHQAMFRLARREFDTVLDLYDRRFRNLASPLVAAMPDFYVDVQNAASMLLRLELRGVAVGARWEELADKAQARIGDHLSAFTLPHWMMALAGAGRDAKAQEMLAAMKESASEVVREVALPVCQAVLAHRRGQYGRTVTLMVPLLGRFQELGGSHAQRDVLTQLFVDSRKKLLDASVQRPGDLAELFQVRS